MDWPMGSRPGRRSLRQPPNHDVALDSVLSGLPNIGILPLMRNRCAKGPLVKPSVGPGEDREHGPCVVADVRDLPIVVLNAYLLQALVKGEI